MAAVPESYRSLLEEHPPRLSRVRDGIFLGDLIDACHVLLTGWGEVGAVLNMADLTDAEPPYPPVPGSVVYCHLPLVDFQYCDPRIWHEAADFIAQHKDGVLVHCLAGISRSPTAVLAYLVKYEKLGPWRAMRLLRKVRPQVRPAPELMESFREFRKSLRWS